MMITMPGAGHRGEAHVPRDEKADGDPDPDTAAAACLRGPEPGSPGVWSDDGEREIKKKKKINMNGMKKNRIIDTWLLFIFMSLCFALLSSESCPHFVQQYL